MESATVCKRCVHALGKSHHAGISISQIEVITMAFSTLSGAVSRIEIIKVKCLHGEYPDQYQQSGWNIFRRQSTFCGR